MKLSEKEKLFLLGLSLAGLGLVVRVVLPVLGLGWILGCVGIAYILASWFLKDRD